MWQRACWYRSVTKHPVGASYLGKSVVDPVELNVNDGAYTCESARRHRALYQGKSRWTASSMKPSILLNAMRSACCNCYIKIGPATAMPVTARHFGEAIASGFGSDQPCVTSSCHVS